MVGPVGAVSSVIYTPSIAPFIDPATGLHPIQHKVQPIAPLRRDSFYDCGYHSDVSYGGRAEPLPPVEMAGLERHIAKQRTDSSSDPRGEIPPSWLRV